jgi:hypothetical protein
MVTQAGLNDWTMTITYGYLPSGRIDLMSNIFCLVNTLGRDFNSTYMNDCQQGQKAETIVA